MAVAQVVDARVNPSDREQRVVLWGNGRIDVRNGPPVNDGPQWFDRPDQPVAVAIWVVDWDEMAGYVLDKQGGVHAFGGADVLTIGGANGAVVPGVPYSSEGIFLDWSWDPNNPGRGVVLDGYGELHAFGGAPPPPRTGRRWSSPSIAARLEMSWDPVPAAYTLDRFGGIHADYAASSAPTTPEPPYWSGWHAARHLAITKWTTPAAGYTLDLFGAPLAWGGAPKVTSWSPYNSSGDWARVMRVLSVSNPTRIWSVWAGGQEFEIIASTPPTVTAGGLVNVSPAATVTDTTRPMLQWDYSDPQRDSQAAFEWMVFTEAFVDSHDMTDPFVHWKSAVTGGNGVDPRLRGVVSPIDLPNGGYRLYVRAQDTAGQWSAWDDHAWTQDVTQPATPVMQTPVVDEDTYSVALAAVTPAGAGVLVRFEYSDDGWVTVWPVRGAEAVPRAAVTTATDRDVPFGPLREYRAVRYSKAPAIASPPSNVVSASLRARTYALTSTADPALGGEVIAVGEMGWSEEAAGGLFYTLGDREPIVLDDGEPKGRQQTLTLDLNGRGEFEKVRALKRSRSTLLLRDPFGEAVYCRIVGRISTAQQREEPLADEDTPLRHSHEVDLPLVEVARPTAAP